MARWMALLWAVTGIKTDNSLCDGTRQRVGAGARAFIPDRPGIQWVVPRGPEGMQVRRIASY